MSVADLFRSLLLIAVLMGTEAGAQSIAERLPILLDADNSTYDQRSGQFVYTGLRISQGAIGIEADRGVTTLKPGGSLDFSDSIWTFSGNVRIDIESARIRSDSAELVFKQHQLQSATVKGEPAKFSDRGRSEAQPLSAEAKKFIYDLAGAAIRFSGNARINEGDNEVAGADLIYDLKAKRVNFKGDPQNNERVRITILPEPEPEATPEQ